MYLDIKNFIKKATKRIMFIILDFIFYKTMSVEPLYLNLNEDGLENLKIIETTYKNIPKKVKQILEKIDGKKVLYDDIVKVLDWSHKQNKGIGVMDVLKNSTIITTSPKPPKRNPELEARLKILKAQQDNRDYNKMVSGITSGKEKRVQMHSYKSQMSTGFNFLLSILACVFGSCYILQGIFPDLAIRICLGLGAGFVLFNVELLLYLKNLE